MVLENLYINLQVILLRTKYIYLLYLALYTYAKVFPNDVKIVENNVFFYDIDFSFVKNSSEDVIRA